VRSPGMSNELRRYNAHLGGSEHSIKGGIRAFMGYVSISPEILTYHHISQCFSA